MTKRESFNAIRTLIADNAELVAFIDHELELLDKKNSYKSNKPTAKQMENAEVKTEIVKVLSGGKAMTITEIADSLSGDYTNQRVSALVTQLVNDGAVVRSVEKRKAYFSLA